MDFRFRWNLGREGGIRIESPLALDLVVRLEGERFWVLEKRASMLGSWSRYGLGGAEALKLLLDLYNR